MCIESLKYETYNIDSISVTDKEIKTYLILYKILYDNIKIIGTLLLQV